MGQTRILPVRKPPGSTPQKALWQGAKTGHLGVDLGSWVWKFGREGVEELANKTISWNHLRALKFYPRFCLAGSRNKTIARKANPGDDRIVFSFQIGEKLRRTRVQR
jgi:hypothetical protein